MKVGKMLHTRYRVNDLDKATEFYTEVLGLEETRRSTSPRGSTLVFFRAPDTAQEIEICHYPAAGEVTVQEDLTHLAFEVEDIEAFARHSEAKGYPLTDGPHTTGSGSVIAFIDAPDGYEIELIQKPK
ncbi:MAG: VOC family protein [Verrucomicrobiota bacterium]